LQLSRGLLVAISAHVRDARALLEACSQAFPSQPLAYRPHGWGHLDSPMPKRWRIETEITAKRFNPKSLGIKVVSRVVQRNSQARGKNFFVSGPRDTSIDQS
jgi:hypothetical protein